MSFEGLLHQVGDQLIDSAHWFETGKSLTDIRNYPPQVGIAAAFQGTFSIAAVVAKPDQDLYCDTMTHRNGMHYKNPDAFLAVTSDHGK